MIWKFFRYAAFLLVFSIICIFGYIYFDENRQAKAKQSVVEEVLGNLKDPEFFKELFDIEFMRSSDGYVHLSQLPLNFPYFYGESRTVEHFISAIEPASDQSFRVTMSLFPTDPANFTDEGLFFEYLVEPCGAKYCAYDSGKFELLNGTGANPYSTEQLRRREQVFRKNGYEFKVRYGLILSADGAPLVVKVGVADPATNALERYSRDFIQLSPPNYWRTIPVFNLIVPSGHEVIFGGN